MITRTFTLPFPVSVNRHLGVTSTGKRFLHSSQKRWRNAAFASMIAAKLKPISGPVAIAIWLHPPDRRRRDADNLNKCILDSLVRGEIIADDSSGIVRSVKAEWASPDSKNPRAVVEIRQLEMENPAAA